MEHASTPQRLLKNAERLMAEKGIAATSVREITDVSDANVAAVNYYFGSKTELLLDLLRHRFEQLDRELLKRINAAEEQAEGGVPAIRDLAAAYFDTLAFLGFNEETGELDPFILLIQRASAEQETLLESAQDYTAPGISKMIDLMAVSVPAERRKDLDERALMGLLFTSSVAAMPSMSMANRNEVLYSAIRDFLFDGLEAFFARFSKDM